MYLIVVLNHTNYEGITMYQFVVDSKNYFAITDKQEAYESMVHHRIHYDFVTLLSMSKSNDHASKIKCKYCKNILNNSTLFIDILTIMIKYYSSIAFTFGLN